MQNGKTSAQSKIKAGDRRLEAARKGWNDAINNIPYDYKYVDSLDFFCGIAYENWRLRAFDAIKKNLKTPKWNTDNGVPTKVQACRNYLTNIYRETMEPTAARNEKPKYMV